MTGNHVKMGIVGLPNVGKSTTFNLMCGMQVPAWQPPASRGRSD
jgi:ribosome-binding ATPase YchF (GTP1/OBG family)